MRRGNASLSDRRFTAGQSRPPRVCSAGQFTMINWTINYKFNHVLYSKLMFEPLNDLKFQVLKNTILKLVSIQHLFECPGERHNNGEQI